MSDDVLKSKSPEVPSSQPVSADEMRRCAEVLNAIVNDRGLLVQLSKEERLKLVSAAGRVSRPTRDDERRLRRTFNKVQKVQERSADRLAKSETGIRSARETAVFVAPAQLTSSAANPETQYRDLKNPKNCYVCKQDFTKLHFFYDAMCPACAEFNYSKRFQSARLDGWTAVITGSRLKIGYHAALKMLRAGAQVIATTRFPHDSALRYSREPDFAEWRDRLHVHGLDLRHSPSVEIFTRYLNERCDTLDLLINNAAQTVRRPVGFYTHLLEFENARWSQLPAEIRPILQAHEDCKSALASGDRVQLDGPETPPEDSTGLAVLGETSGAGMGIRASAALSQVRYTYDDVQSGRDVFPAGRTDADLQQIDLRMQNSWRMSLADVPTPEMLEVQLVNAVAPFILCSKLKPLMLKNPTGQRHIVNVSAMEGIFSRGTKTDKHPHTNMAKAALNMMTLTSAPDYAADGIFMNAVDTGWVTDEDPAAHAARKREQHDFQPPLDIVDGAARVCDPFFAGLISGEHVWGKFLKDYKPASW